MAGIAAAASAGIAGGMMKSALAGVVGANADVAATSNTVGCTPSAARVGARQLDHLLRNGRAGALPLFSPFSPLTCRRGSLHRRGPRSRLLVRAAKLPAGVEPPSETPRLSQNLIGFTEAAEVLNSRAAMIGIFGFLAVEFIANKPILEMVGVEIGKGLNLPF